MKTCKTCNQVKNDDDFSPDKRMKSGLKSSCKICMNKYQKKQGYQKYKNRKEYQKKWQTELRKTTKDKEYKQKYLSDYQESDVGKIAEIKRQIKKAKKPKTIVTLAEKLKKLISK